MDIATFSDNELTLFATLHALLIVSKAATRLGDAANTLVPGQPRADIRSIGNVLRHEYDGVDPEIICRVIRGGDLASLKLAITDTLSRLRERKKAP